MLVKTRPFYRRGELVKDSPSDDLFALRMSSQTETLKPGDRVYFERYDIVKVGPDVVIIKATADSFHPIALDQKAKKELARWGDLLPVFLDSQTVCRVQSDRMFLGFPDGTTDKDIELILHVHSLGVIIKKAPLKFEVCVPHRVSPFVLSGWLVERAGLVEAEPLFWEIQL